LTDANSRVDGYVLKAYKARPTLVPEHLRSATARLAAYHAVSTDGVRPDYVREDHKETLAYLKDLANCKFDLGVVAPRPRMRKPAVHISMGVGGGNGGRGGRGRGCY
jgi:phage gp36-like protein